MNYRAQSSKSQQNITKRAHSGAPTYRSTAKSAQGTRPAPAKRSTHLPVERQASTLSEIRKNIRPMLLVKQDKVTTVKAATRKPFPVGAVVMVTICTLLFMFTVMSYVQINEYTIEVALLRGELTDLASEKKDLALAIEEKNDMLKIEQYAVDNLGMVKADQLTKKHISLDQEDKVEVVETEPSKDGTVVSGVMSAIGENFRGLWEYIGG
ncbi:MAG: hypothetical protein IJA55_07430 [Clostridia bacterium]|nr:hypothetical protein [Clostridia bacterium]